MLRRALPMLLVSLLSLAAVGCAGTAGPRAEVPESASLAPADAIVYGTLTTNESSAQWEAVEKVIDRIPGARDDLMGALGKALDNKGLTWTDDVAPALGPEVVLVVTKDAKPIVLTKPDSEARLDALLAKSDEPSARGSVDGWAAIAERQADLAAYEASLSRGTLADADQLSAGFATLPGEALARVWVDLEGVTRQFGQALEDVSGSQQLDVGVEWLSAGLAAEEDGVRLAMGIRTPDGGGTQYQPKLFGRVPANTVFALSFGGTQRFVDRIQGPLAAISDKFEQVAGVSLDGVLDAFSGEGVVYLRGSIPVDVTVVLAPPDPDTAWQSIDELARSVAHQAGKTVRTVQDGAIDVHVVEAKDVTVRYAQLDADTLIVTTGAYEIDDFTGLGPRLATSDPFRRAAGEVGLEGRTGGFAYLDINGLLYWLEAVNGEPTPSDVRNVVQSLDSFILESSTDGDVTTLTGVLRLND